MSISKIILEWLGHSVYCLLFAYYEEVAWWIPAVRFVFRLIFGVLVAFLLWHIMTWNISINFILNVKAEIVYYSFIAVVGLLYLLNRNARTIILLIFVSMLGHTGRNYNRAVAFSMLISGPIDNLVTNAAEVARVFACSTVLTYNLTKTRFDLMARPFTQTLKNMKEDISEVQGNFRELQLILDDLKYSMEHTDIKDNTFAYYLALKAANSTAAAGNMTARSQLPNPKHVQAQMVRNMGNRCKHQLHNGQRVCEEVFFQGYRKCVTNFPDWLGMAICWPYRVDIICKVNMFGNPDKVCDARKMVPSSFGRTYVSFLKMDRKLFAKSCDIEITYQVQNVTTSEQLQSAKDTSELLIEEFNQKRRIFDIVMHTIENVLCLFVLAVVWSAIKYHWKYRSNVEFDNNFVTDYFKHVDARRKSTGKSSILPLHTFERNIYVDTENLWRHNYGQNRSKIFHLVLLSLEVIIVAIFILIDRLVVNLLCIINQHSLITYHQEGEHQVRFRINGTGVMARLLRTTMQNFNIHENFTTVLTNEECLPDAHVLPARYYLKLFLLYILICILVFKSSVLMRLRRYISSYFYYKREKQRIIFLYNNILRNRRALLDTMRERVDHNLSIRHAQGKTNIFLILRVSYPVHFGWLGSYKCAKRSCLICNSLEDSKFIICPGCTLPFCRECFRDIRRVCIFCDQVIHVDDIDENVKTE